MMIRPYEPSDATALAGMALKSGYPYPAPDSPMMEGCLVVMDDEGEPMAAIAAKRIVELYLWKREALRPAVSLSILRSMHAEMATELRKRGYSDANVFLPPSICERFGRRLERTFGWTKNWSSLCRHF